MRLLEAYLPLEKQGLPLILDADAIALAKDFVFHGNAILTPHPGEFAAYTGLSKDAILSDPIAALRRCAVEKQAHILLKGHVLYAASPDGRLGVIDGMNPALATGGSGDVLAGFCAAIAARQKPFDGYTCICAAASLLIRAAESIAGAFFDPAELARAAALVAGQTWLPKGGNSE
jgi:NAD(P)H-hydrate epimerase